MPFEVLLSAAAIVLTFVAYYPYVRATLRREIKPHVFSWVIWSATTCIVFFAQLDDQGGAGAWPIGVSGAITVAVAVLAWGERGDMSATRIDWLFFAAALGSLPLWFVTSDPLWSVVVLTSVDLLGFGPTTRKAYARPFEENMTFFGLFAVRNAVATAALENVSFTTVFFPAATGIACLLLIAMVAHRRKVVAGTAPS